MKKGFTLIELLVVVLIIGILASIALPQYQAAVDKSRLSKYFPVLSNIRQAQEIYYMTRSDYSKNIHDLDVDITNLCQNASASKILYNCQDDLFIDIDYVASDNHSVRLLYCPGAGTMGSGREECFNKAVLDLNFYFAHSKTMKNNEIRCNKQNNSDRGDRLCKTLKF